MQESVNVLYLGGEKPMKKNIEERPRESKSIDQRLESIEESIRLLSSRFGALEQKLGALEQRIEQRFGVVEQKLGALEQRIEQRFGVVEQRLESMEKRIEAFEWRFEALRDLVIMEREVEGIRPRTYVPVIARVSQRASIFSPIRD
ncbi:MAG: hypothetical protein DRJ69_07460 [Thermoprotei archaeon]|nr:MAG: hypothetical protein DRJ69_07460 [Thermoprotei archaeon]